MTSRLSKLLDFWPGAALLLGLNVVDALSTQALLELGVAEELNPLMRWAWDVSPFTFWAAKFGLVLSGLMVLALFASRQLACRVTLLMSGVYLLVLAIHFHGWLIY